MGTREEKPAGNNQQFDDFDSWWEYGYTHNWVGPPVCMTHDGWPTTLEEDDYFEEGHDACIHIIRLYEDVETKQAVEENHSPSCWRAMNRMWNKDE